MKVKEIKKHVVFIVRTDEEQHNKYIRNGPDSWDVRMGESYEPVFDCEEIEREFQKFQKNQNVVYL